MLNCAFMFDAVNPMIILVVEKEKRYGVIL